ncbi:MAG: SDR family NAD(P)-dependent oxidoreductase [Betaproteobacteria bacterium]|nr:MAG: SDR family NAD(P)-dependent oxidoreductase [Betaproteobacteria bacterium]
MSMTKWDTNDIPDQKGRVVIVTGSSSGIGKEAARVLAGKNASVVLAVRNVNKGQNVANEIRRESPDSHVSVRELDLADLKSVKAFADSFIRDYDRLDILINNAGVMMCPYAKTRDGFEMQFGTNHLGHFALVGQLLPLLKKTSRSRLVALSSLAHKGGKLDFTDLNWINRSYNTNQAYFDSKLANLYFAYLLAEKVGAEGSNPKVTIAHPGWTATELQRHSGMMGFLNKLLAQGVDMGALPTLRAATDEGATPGMFYGPARFFEMHGHPVKVKSTARSHDMDTARELWKQSEEMTGVSY